MRFPDLKADLNNLRFWDGRMQEGLQPVKAFPLRAELHARPEFDFPTLIYHIEQSDATATDGYWHASVNEARSVLESPLLDFGRSVVTSDGRTHRPARARRSRIAARRSFPPVSSNHANRTCCTSPTV